MSEFLLDRLHRNVRQIPSNQDTPKSKYYETASIKIGQSNARMRLVSVLDDSEWVMDNGVYLKGNFNLYQWRDSALLRQMTQDTTTICLTDQGLVRSYYGAQWLDSMRLIYLEPIGHGLEEEAILAVKPLMHLPHALELTDDQVRDFKQQTATL